MDTITVSGELPFGYKDKEGEIHRAFAMRALTLGDMERMEAEYPELLASENSLTLRRLSFAYALKFLGKLDAKDITPDLLAELPAQDFAALSQAEDDIAKKLRAAYGRGGEDAS